MQFDKKIKPFQGFAGFGVSNYRDAAKKVEESAAESVEKAAQFADEAVKKAMQYADEAAEKALQFAEKLRDEAKNRFGN